MGASLTPMPACRLRRLCIDGAGVARPARVSATSYVCVSHLPAERTPGAAYSELVPAQRLPHQDRRHSRLTKQGAHMLHYAVVFLVVALIAALFGFGGIAAGAVGIAKVLFVVFLVMAVVSFLIGLLR